MFSGLRAHTHALHSMVTGVVVEWHDVVGPCEGDHQVP